MHINDMITLATAFTLKGERVKRDHWIGAIGIRKDGAIVMSRNEGSTVRTPSAHAEARLIKKLGRNSQMVVVIRVTKRGTLALAKPCANCELLLRRARVRKVYYTTGNGILDVMNLDNE